MSTLTPNASFQTSSARSGATLIVTLGILTLLSVMAVTFLISSRIQRQMSSSKQSRFVARNYMDAGLNQAIRQIENAFTYPNYTDERMHEGAYLTAQRLAPVNQWFSYEYARTNDPNIAFQATDVLASPTALGAPSVNLFSPAVMRFVPPCLTNGLQLSSRKSHPFRSGWIRVFDEHASDEQLLAKPGRVAYLIFNCSGFADANTFQCGPTTQKLQRVCFSQTDVTNWFAKVQTIKSEPYNTLFGTEEVGLDPNPLASPFFHLSYDPGPDIYPLHYDCFETCTSVGLNRFGAYPVINLNVPQMYKAMAALKEQATYWKFNINSVTNFFALGAQSTETASPWFNDARFRAEWFDPVVFLVEMMRHEEPATTLHRWPDSTDLAWTIANFMDADRIPQVSDFPTAESAEPELATRANCAVEDVPLINKVTIFDIFKPGHPGQNNPDAPKPPDYYFNGNTHGLSNQYAVAVEYWYPFAPNLPLPNTACYIGIYTNAADVQTTTNRPWNSNELRDWFRWNNIDQSNSVMRTLFYSWARAYTSEVGPGIANHPLWQTITEQSDLWFTPAMTNHPSWPVADTNGAFSIEDTPIWQAFYPATNVVVSTNEITGVVSTNIYTELSVTNAYIDWVSDVDSSTNRLVRQIGTTYPEPYPVLLWSNLTSSVHTTNVWGALLTPDDTLVPFYTPGTTNTLLAIVTTPDSISVTVSNDFTGIVTNYLTASLVLSPWSPTNDPLFAAQTNILITTEVVPVEPLPMPEDLGRALSALFLLLPTNSVPALYTFLMLTPDQFTPDQWRNLLEYFNQNPSITDRLMPAHQAPTLGNMTQKDRHVLWPKNEKDETVILDPEVNQKITGNQFQGYFWTVYPKQVVSFMDVQLTKPVEGQPGSESEYVAVTNYYALGDRLNGEINTIWLRPVTTVNPSETVPDAGEELSEADVIVDEALLSHKGDDPVPVWGWTAVTNLYIPEPRHNAFARDWQGFPAGKLWNDPDILNTTNLNTGVHELPFIHFNTPFTSIGDLGHIYAAYERSTENPELFSAIWAQQKYDTLTFSTRAGAALLDIFTVSPTNAPKRGLVQANTQHRPVIQTLLADVKIGWTNKLDATSQHPLYSCDSNLKGWTDVYADALTNAPLSMGWRSYADMLPSLSTNQLFSKENVWGSAGQLHPMHDYTEDVLRGLVDKVSFRQNIFVIIVATQALSPASTDTHPIVLAEQRAAVTVIRDAYTGKWMVHSWVWLTD